MTAGGRAWARIGAYGCIGVGEHEKQARKHTHGPNAHDFPGTMAGKFPKMQAWVRGDMVRVTAGNGWSRMVASANTSRYERCGPPKQHKTKRKPEDSNRSGDNTKQQKTTKNCLDSNNKKQKKQLDCNAQWGPARKKQGMQRKSEGRGSGAKKLLACTASARTEQTQQ